tara:strand:+ start:48 stop:416 length:369 start_codon:yes stop_codon:yes gene_type:complete
MLGHQEAFDIIIAHLRKQKRQAINELGLCSYKTDTGDMCAVGCLIQGIKLTTGENNAGVSDLLDTNLEAQARFKEVSLSFLEAMQVLHDNTEYYDTTGFTANGEKHIARIARNHHLSPPEES